mmetsp:Transcript_5607/g.18215  ORF Transcript_5607/g.18215 Transcript_5607/m.18215 type:complete len:221 (-) Transcript_5607:2881-3543(-)
MPPHCHSSSSRRPCVPSPRAQSDSAPSATRRHRPSSDVPASACSRPSPPSSTRPSQSLRRATSVPAPTPVPTRRSLLPTTRSSLRSTASTQPSSCRCCRTCRPNWKTTRAKPAWSPSNCWAESFTSRALRSSTNRCTRPGLLGRRTSSRRFARPCAPSLPSSQRPRGPWSSTLSTSSQVASPTASPPSARLPSPLRWAFSRTPSTRCSSPIKGLRTPARR